MTSLSTDETSSKKDQIFFSIIIPMYNRATTIQRCLDSCLSQSFESYEIIVVDDGSEDDSIAVVESYLPHSYITLVKSPENRGKGAARGIGITHSRGQWLLFLDSDDEFHPGAFQAIYEQAKAAPGEVGEIRFCYWSEEFNQITPIPLMSEGLLDFVDYLRWLDEVKNSDLFRCHRREIYDVIDLPYDRKSDGYLCFKIASKFKIMMSKEVVVTMHCDADNRSKKEKSGQTSFAPEFLRQLAYDNAIASREILAEFGEDLRKYCPKRYNLQKRMVGNYYFRAGCRFKGCRYMFPYLLRYPLDFAAWGVIFLGLIGPRALLRGMKILKYGFPK